LKRVCPGFGRMVLMVFLMLFPQYLPMLYIWLAALKIYWVLSSNYELLFAEGGLING
jgi:hypothetical protein